MSHILKVSAVILLVGFAMIVLGESRPLQSQQFPSADRTAVGRYQIVNGTPELTRNIMLLDTATGQTWQICTIFGPADPGNPGKSIEFASWCLMSRGN
jgi:hypothetical protein